MRIGGILFLLLLLTGSAKAQKISFGETSYDFGQVRESDAVFHDFYFMNTGEVPLLIQSVLTGCGCTSSEWSRKPVLPGEKAYIRVSYHPEGRSERKFTKVAEVYTNSKNFGTHSGVHNLYISGEVLRGEKEIESKYVLRPGVAKIEKRVKKEDVFSKILTRMQGELLSGRDARTNDSLTLQWVARLGGDGRWNDIDYPCYFRTNWEPVKHLERVGILVRSYVNPASQFCGNDSLYEAVRNALAFWKKASPKSHNWWFNQIAAPQNLGDILVLMESGAKVLPDDLQNDLYGMMAWPDPRKWTGANKLDIALHHLQRGCLLKNDSIVRVAAEQIFYPVRITTSEGIQPDMSYHQHDNQLYIGSYGTVFSEGITRVAYWLSQTPYAMENERWKLFSAFIRDTYLNVFRGAYIDFSVVGRGISRENALNGSSTVGMLKKLEELDGTYAKGYADALTRFTRLGQSSWGREDRNCIYWRSDYALHNRQGFDFSVRTASVRTRKTESGNGENLYGGFLADGATCIRVNGNEYYNIFPVWDWNKIPGVTAPEMSTAIATNWGEMGTAVFSGGVSNGRYGTMAYAMDDYSMKARKSWFFFDKEVVCLGAGICSNHPNRIVTCVNQCLLDGRVKKDGEFLLNKGEDKMEMETESIWHDSVLYVFPEKTKVWLYTGKQTGNWSQINYNYSAEQMEKEVFKLWINHGQEVENGKYAYIVVPGIAQGEEYKRENVEIAMNSKEIQAVYRKADDLLQIVFYEAGDFKYEKFELSVDRPCVMMVERVGGKVPSVFIADPAQVNKEIAWQLKNGNGKFAGKVRTDQGKTVKG